MKCVAPFAIALVLLINACKKPSDGMRTPNNSLQGTWELRAMYGGMMTTIPTFPNGNGTRLVFDGATFTRFEQNKQIDSGAFAIVADNGVQNAVGLVIPANRFPARIEFNGKPDPKVFYEISNDSLYTLQGFFPLDGGSASTYVRIR
ncbi:MAG: hypothetical protein J7539_09990 [Niabella sp.]|nr:hypothetical protein [Niabella sp.]